jgi:hypothetical protein
MFLAFSGFCAWVVFGKGAEKLEGWLAAITIDVFSGALSARYLKFYVALVWLIGCLALVGPALTGQAT